MIDFLAYVILGLIILGDCYIILLEYRRRKSLEEYLEKKGRRNRMADYRDTDPRNGQLEKDLSTKRDKYTQLEESMKRLIEEAKDELTNADQKRLKYFAEKEFGYLSLFHIEQPLLKGVF